MRIAAICAVSVLMLLGPSAALAETVSFIEDAPLFQNPGDAAPIATIHHGVRFELTGCRDDGWCEVVKGEQKGWARKEVLRSEDVAEEPVDGADEPMDDADEPADVAEEPMMEPEMAGTATVKDDVDLYDVPGGVGKIIGMLEKTDTVGLKGCRDDNWCEVDGGWVWGDFLDR